MSKKSISELTKKESSILDKYLKCKQEEKKNKEALDNLKEEVIAIVKAKDGKIIHKGYNITTHENTTFEYSESIQSMEKAISEIKKREETLSIAKVKHTSSYVKTYELKNQEIKQC